MPGRLHLILGDQLSMTVASLKDFHASTGYVLMAECVEETRYVPHHPQKMTLILSAMRHFAEELRGSGYQVIYYALKEGCASFTEAVERALAETEAEEIVTTFPGEYRVLQEMRGWSEKFGIGVDILDDDRFISSPQMFAEWAQGRKQLRMEYFYRELRKKTGILMSGDVPVGGQWNYDKDNRKALPKGAVSPPVFLTEPDDITQTVLEMVETRFDAHFGNARPFGYAVTADRAQQALDHFLFHSLPGFGDYQDAMRSRDPFLHHSVLSGYLNIGLLDPLDVCRRVEAEYHAGRAPLNAVEGFIRQILGWREYVRGLYWLKMPGYDETNFFGADRPLPDFFWSGDTDMACLADAIGQTREFAYAHHIQRLMVIGNFALLAGLAPKAVQEWYLAVYLDAFEWVELPNTHGMALFADGGVMASKPYAASGKYIDRMSDYCKGCRYSPKETAGDEACPFNGLYWHFIARHADELGTNPRMGMIYRTWAKMAPEKREAALSSASRFLNRLC